MLDIARRNIRLYGMDVQSLIDQAGGVGKLATLLGVAHNTVCDWKRTGLIPGNRVAQVCARLNLPVENVLKLARPPKSRPQAVA